MQQQQHTITAGRPNNNKVPRLVMATDITDGYNPWIFWNPSSVVNFFGKMEKRRCRRHL